VIFISFAPTGRPLHSSCLDTGIPNGYVRNDPVSRIDADGHGPDTPSQPPRSMGSYSDSDMVDSNPGDVPIDTVLAAQNSSQQQQPSPSQGASTHFASISFWPSGAGHLGHMGIGVDTDDTSGFATQKPHSFLGFLLGFFFPGRVQNDIQTHTNQATGEVAPHKILHIAISAKSAGEMSQAIKDRFNHPGPYNLYFRNCAGFVEHVLHAGGVGGVPHSEIFFPPVAFGMLWYVNTWR
jgi:hypothetical protein